jgi:hypothetical protein
MSKKGDYSDKRQLRAITSHGKRHSSTVTGSLWGIAPERPDLGGSEKKKKSKKKKKESQILVENMTISIDLDVKNLRHSEGFIQKLSSSLGVVRVKKDFHVLSTAEKIIRALAKGKFKNVGTIKLEDDVLYHHPEKFYDIDDALEKLMKVINKKKTGDHIFMNLLSKEHKDCTVDVKVSCLHMPWMHDILIKFHGELPDEYFRRVINYLEDHLKIENIENDWKEA